MEVQQLDFSCQRSRIEVPEHWSVIQSLVALRALQPTTARTSHQSSSRSSRNLGDLFVFWESPGLLGFFCHIWWQKASALQESRALCASHHSVETSHITIILCSGDAAAAWGREVLHWSQGEHMLHVFTEVAPGEDGKVQDWPLVFEQSMDVDVRVCSSGGPAGAFDRLWKTSNIHIQGEAPVFKLLPPQQIWAISCLYRILRGSAVFRVVFFPFPCGGPAVCSVNWDIDSMQDGRPGKRSLLRRDSI